MQNTLSCKKYQMKPSNEHCPPPPLSAGSNNMLLNLSAAAVHPPPLVSRVHSKEETEAAHDLLSLSQSLPPQPPPQQPEQPPTPPTLPEDIEHGLKMPQG